MRLLLATAACLSLTLTTGYATLAATQEGDDLSSREEFLKVVRSHFDSWDLNHDGRLSSSEIAEALGNFQIRGDEAAALGAIKGLDRKLQKEGHPHQFSLADFSAQRFSGDNQPQYNHQLVNTFSSMRKKIAKEARVLFARGIPHIESIHQGRSGDCYFVSTVGGLVNADPDAIVRMIQSNPDGSYTVTFPRHRPEVVAPPTDAEIAVFSDAGNDGIWFHVLEKAFSQIHARATAPNAIEPLNTIAHGGDSKKAIILLTGHAVRVFKMKDSAGVNIGHMLANALDDHRIIEVSTGKHACTVTGYDGDRKEVTIWNPWGTTKLYKYVGKKMDEGFFTIPMEELRQKFVAVSVEERRAADSSHDIDVHGGKKPK